MRRSHAVLLLAAALAGWNLWGYDLWAPDEPYFGEGAREMVVDGQWAVPHVNGVVTTDKPPLFFWLIALLSVPFGTVTSAAARLPSALAAVGSVALTMRLARRAGADDDGATAGAILAVTYLFWDKSRSAQIEALLCFLILVSLCAFDAFRAGSAEGRRAGLLFWTAAALAVLAKGPVGLLLPLGIAVVTLLLDRRVATWSAFAPWSGPLVFVAVVGTWMIVATVGGHGDYSVWGALKKHFIDRAIHGLHHTQPPWYYLEILPVQLLPWSGLLPGALLLAWRRRASPADRFLLVAALFVVLFFTISTEKRDLYVLPAYPALALLFSRLVSAVSPASGGDAAGPLRSPRWVTVPQAIQGGILILAGAALPFVAERHGGLPVAPLLVVGIVLAAGGAAMIAAGATGKPRAAVAVTIATAAAAYVTAASALFPALDPIRSARSFATEVRRATAGYRQQGGRVLAFGAGNLPQAIALYTDGIYLEEVVDPGDLLARMDAAGPVIVVSERSRLDELPAVAGRAIVIREAAISLKPVVLFTNRAASDAASGGAVEGSAGSRIVYFP